MFQTHRKLIIAIVLILSQVSNSSEINSDEDPAKVIFTPMTQYLPFQSAGIVQCYIKSNLPLQFVTWTKDKRLLEPYETKDIVIMNNGSLLFNKVNESHQGNYTCTPYNSQGTQGSSGPMQVLVRKPPSFTTEPNAIYKRKVGETVKMHCDAEEENGTQKPTIQWQRTDGTPLPKNRIRISDGNITIEGLRRSDFAYYQCVASNEVSTLIAVTQLVVEGTQPYGPNNLTGIASEFAVTLSWLPGYSEESDYTQDYMIWYRKAGVSEWSKFPVTSSKSTHVTIDRLSPKTTYDFQVGKENALGEGMKSHIITVQTLDADVVHKVEVNPAPFFTSSDELEPALSGQKPSPPRNLTITENANGILISWQAPLEHNNLVQYYTIMYKTDGPYRNLNKSKIGSEEASYLVKNLVGGRTYYFKVIAYTSKNFESSDEIRYVVPTRVKLNSFPSTMK